MSICRASPNKKSITSIVNDASPKKDSVILSYLCEMIEEALQQNQIFNSNDLYNLLVEPSKNYEIYSNEQEFCSLSQSIFDGLIQHQYIENPIILRQRILKSIRVGMTVNALYSVDKQWYDAKVDDIEMIDDMNKIGITYIEYGNSEWIDPVHIKLEIQKEHKVKAIKIRNKMNDNNIINYINYQIYHSNDKRQNKLIESHEIKEEEMKQQQKEIEIEIDTISEEKQIEIIYEKEGNDIDEYSDDMLRLNGYYFCYKPKCNGYLYVADKQKLTHFICSECKSTNCVICSSVHKIQLKISENELINLQCYDYQFLFNNQFLKYWQFNTYDAKTKAKQNIIGYLKNSKMCISYGVKKNCKEWKWIIKCMNTKEYDVMKIERIQNADLWNKYYNYYKSSVLNGMNMKQMNVWHGTRGTKPCVIWKNLGFDVGHAGVGGCIWFAVNNSYSMNGFSHTIHRHGNQVFLAFVAAGNNSDVVLIRNDLILNVFKNEATYPAYVVTYN